VAQVGEELFKVAVLVGNHLAEEAVQVAEGLQLAAPEFSFFLFVSAVA
jgi:hypothetical protein